MEMESILWTIDLMMFDGGGGGGDGMELHCQLP